MTVALAVVSAAAAFALAAWAGTFLSDRLCAGLTPCADGPRTIGFVRWPFALAGGLVGAMSLLHGAAWPHLALLALVVLALASCTAADLRCGILPDVCTLGSLALVIGLGAAWSDWIPAFGAAFVALPFAVIAFISRGRGMGWGDVKLAALGGAVLGARDATLAFLLAAVAAYAIARRSGETHRPIAFGPYLAGSIALALTFAPGV